MATTLSGWPTLDNPDWDDPRLTRLAVPGTPCVFYGRRDVAPYFVAMIVDYAKTIAPLTKRGDVDAYDARPARAGGGRASDHYGGVAVDLLASGVGAQGSSNRSFWLRKEPQVVALLKKYSLLYWGGDASIGEGEFRGRYHNAYIDPMHFYARPGTDVAAFRAEIARMRIRPDGTAAPAYSAHILHLLTMRKHGKRLTAHQLHELHVALGR